MSYNGLVNLLHLEKQNLVVILKINFSERDKIFFQSGAFFRMGHNICYRMKEVKKIQRQNYLVCS